MTKRTGILLGVAGAGIAAYAASEYRALSREDSLDGQVVLITGGSRGFGLALARRFARNGARIAICARDERELEAASSDLRKRGVEVFPFVCDVSRQDQVEHMVAAVRAQYGRIDILVNNAGVILVGPVQSLEAADFETAMNTIFWGTVYPTLAVLPEFLSRQAGRIVNISSIGGKVGMPHLAPYTSAKFAVTGFSQALGAELRSQGITVTAIHPGLMRTGSFVQALFKGNQRKESRWFTLGATLPGISMSADRAASQVVTAVKRGFEEKTLSTPANAIGKINSLFPGGTTAILGAVAAALLPTPVDNKLTRRGAAFWPRMNPLVRTLTSLGIKAMQNYNQRA